MPSFPCLGNPSKTDVNIFILLYILQYSNGDRGEKEGTHGQMKIIVKFKTPEGIFHPVLY